jgi:26S proteasome regulatory subunit N11
MGLLLGEVVDDYSIRVLDSFAMPQAGSSVSVEAVDPVYQKEFMDLLQQTGRPEAVVGWYHSHPSYGCWLSSTDMNTAASFEQITAHRSVSVVVDPIQSVKGKVVIDCFRNIPKEFLMSGREARQTTSLAGTMHRPNAVQLVNGLNKHYYALNLSFRKNALETRMLMNYNKREWSKGLQQPRFEASAKSSRELLGEIAKQAGAYAARVAEEGDKTAAQLAVEGTGKTDNKRRVEGGCGALMTSALAETLGLALSTAIF